MNKYYFVLEKNTILLKNKNKKTRRLIVWISQRYK